jgi:glycosyltransferase involved in cell wall biosynthesis
MASKVAVVATNVGGIPEVISDGMDGLLVPAADPDTLAKKIIYLLKDRSQANKLAQKGYEKIRTQFSLQSMLNKYEEMYSDLLQ